MICLSPEFKLNGNIIKKSQVNVTQTVYLNFATLI